MLIRALDVKTSPYLRFKKQATSKVVLSIKLMGDTISARHGLMNIGLQDQIKQGAKGLHKANLKVQV
jgi:hypothetical protein